MELINGWKVTATCTELHSDEEGNMPALTINKKYPVLAIEHKFFITIIDDNKKMSTHWHGCFKFEAE